MNTISHSDPAFTYENLIRAAFECGKYEDPLGLAHQELYEQALAQPIGHDLKLGLAIALRKVSHEFRKQDDEARRLKELELQVWSVENQDQIREIMDEATEIFYQLGYR